MKRFLSIYERIWDSLLKYWEKIEICRTHVENWVAFHVLSKNPFAIDKIEFLETIEYENIYFHYTNNHKKDHLLRDYLLNSLARTKKYE